MNSPEALEVIEYLKENLKIKIETKAIDDYYRGTVGYDIKVLICIAEEEISVDESSISIK